MTQQTIVCTACPNGCKIDVLVEHNEITHLTGFACKKGRAYAVAECTESKRIFTSTAFVRTSNGRHILPVRTDGEIPLAYMRDAVIKLREKQFVPPIREGDILIENILDTGVNVMATSDLS